MTSLVILPSALDNQGFLDLLALLYSAGHLGEDITPYVLLHANHERAYVQIELAFQFLSRLTAYTWGGLHTETISLEEGQHVGQSPGNKIRDYHLLALCTFKPPETATDLLFTTERAMITGPGFGGRPVDGFIYYGASGEANPAYRSVVAFQSTVGTFLRFRRALMEHMKSVRLTERGDITTRAGWVLEVSMLIRLCQRAELEIFESPNLCTFAWYSVPFPLPMLVHTGPRVDPRCPEMREIDNRVSMFAYSYAFTYDSVFNPQVNTVFSCISRVIFRGLPSYLTNSFRFNTCAISFKPGGQGNDTNTPNTSQPYHQRELDPDDV